MSIINQPDDDGTTTQPTNPPLKTVISEAASEAAHSWYGADKHMEDALAHHIQRAIDASVAEAKHRTRDGNWFDEWGSCKVCGGEIPHGHTENCDIYKLECEVRLAKGGVAEATRPLVSTLHITRLFLTGDAKGVSLTMEMLRQIDDTLANHAREHGTEQPK